MPTQQQAPQQLPAQQQAIEDQTPAPAFGADQGLRPLAEQALAKAREVNEWLLQQHAPAPAGPLTQAGPSTSDDSSAHGDAGPSAHDGANTSTPIATNMTEQEQFQAVMRSGLPLVAPFTQAVHATEPQVGPASFPLAPQVRDEAGPHRDIRLL